MKNVKSILLLLLFGTFISCTVEVVSSENKPVTNLAKETSPVDYAKSKLLEALKCKNEQELESVILNFEQFISIMTESGDEGKMVAKNILSQGNVTTQFYDDFVIDSFHQLESMENWDIETISYSIEETKEKMNLKMHKIIGVDNVSNSFSMEIIEAKGVYYLGQIR